MDSQSGFGTSVDAGQSNNGAKVKVHTITGFVKWFDVDRGYGFIIPDNGMSDVLLHISALKRDGYADPLEGTLITCEACDRGRGLYALRVLEVDTSTAIHPSVPRSQLHAEVKPTSDWVKARVKWFNRARGFGFFVAKGVGTDVFIHMENVRKSGLQGLEPDQEVEIRYGEGSKGLTATHVRLATQTAAAAAE